MKLLFANCTADVSHTGSLAVTDAQVRKLLSSGHNLECVYYYGDARLTPFRDPSADKCIRMLLASGVGDDLLKCDAVVVNGEGSFHHRGARNLLCLLKAAQCVGKPTFLVNAVIQDLLGFDDILRAVQDLTVREELSSRFLAGRDIPHRIVLDSILEAGFVDTPDIDLAGAIVCTDWHQSRDHDVGKIIWRYYETQPRTFFYPLVHAFEPWRWHHAVANWRQAELVITGRHHGVYLAGLAGVPFVALPSNTHKVEGIIKTSRLPLPLCTQAGDLERLIKWARENRAVFKEFQAFLRAQTPLSTFEPLERAGSAAPAQSVEEELEVFYRSARKHFLTKRRVVNAYERRFVWGRRVRGALRRKARELLDRLRWTVRE